MEVAGRVRVPEPDNLSSLKRLIIERTEGNPFFMEETVQVLLDEGALVRDGTVKLTKPLGELKIPPTVQAILASRIDRLPPDEKDLLQTLAVIGKEFPLSLVRAVVGTSTDELGRMLDALQLAEFIYEQPAVGDIEYTFKHALTQEVAYNSVLVERRKQSHERIGDAIESLFASAIEDHLGELARHYSRSANAPKAVEYLRLAGRQAHQRFAHTEAIGHLTAALQLLESLPDNEERMRQEVSLQLTFFEAVTAASSPGDDKVGAALTRARELCTRLGDTRRLFSVLVGLSLFYIFKTQWQNGLDTSKQLVEVAERDPNPHRLLWAHTILGQSLLFHGQLADALAHLEKAGALIPAIAEHTSFRVDDPRTQSLYMLGLVLLHLGFPDQALAQSQQAVALARKLGRPYPLGFAYVGACVVRAYRGDVTAAEETANALITLAAERGLALSAAQAMYLRGWCLVQKGMVEEAISELQRARAAASAIGSVTFGGFLASTVGEAYSEAYSRLGRFDEALAALERAESAASPLVASELRRTRGRLLLEAGRCSTHEAEEHFREAIEIARSQNAKSYELRATTNLARLLAKQGKRDEARTMLAEIYGWFTEGFDTADLKNAKALLSELSA